MRSRVRRCSRNMGQSPSPFVSSTALGWILWLVRFSASYNFSSTSSAQVSNASICQNLVPSPRLEQFVDEVPRMKTLHFSNRTQITLGIYKITHKLHRDLPPTPLYAFGTSRATATYPWPTLVAQHGVESYVRYENNLYDEEPMFMVDPTVQWANPKRGGVPTVTHLHGAETESIYDGNPDAWFTAKGDYGPAYVTQNYTYANSQRPTMLWYHDHTFGITRLNILSGLFGIYILNRSPEEKIPQRLPKKQFSIPLAIGDKQFFPNGSINFPQIGDAPKIHPNWCSEYYGDTILLNGKAWPYLNVQPRKYRFQLLNIANARVFVLALSDPRLSFNQIGTDGGLLEKPQTVSSITISTAERVDFIIDFSLVPGSEVFMNNSGPAPYLDGNPSLNPKYNNVLKFIVKHQKKKQLPAQHFLQLKVSGTYHKEFQDHVPSRNP